jgi:hypothetical protein
MRMSENCSGFLLVLALFSAALSAEGLESKDPRLVGERPNASGPPTVISLGIYVLDVDEINDVKQRFSIDMLIDVAWQDPRLALPEGERTGRFRAIPLDTIWTPRILIVNERSLSLQFPRVAEVDDSGNVDYRQRMSGELSTDLLFREFPFDVQRLPIDIISHKYSPDEIIFSLNANLSGDDGSFSAEGWRLRILGAENSEFVLPGERTTRPRLIYFIEAERNMRYYLFTMFLPMTLIIFMSWTAFWLQPDIVPSRIAISTASIFSLIAFGFSIRLTLPAVSYMTRADVFVTGCTLLVFLSLGIAVIGSRWASAGRMEDALRLNAGARWIYVGLFCIVSTIALTI